MRKYEELSEAASCLSKAEPNERLFVLLGRDVAAADTIEYWVRRRIELKKNQPGDPQIVEALMTAKRMREEFEKLCPSCKSAEDVRALDHPVDGIDVEFWDCAACTERWQRN